MTQGPGDTLLGEGQVLALNKLKELQKGSLPKQNVLGFKEIVDGG